MTRIKSVESQAEKIDMARLFLFLLLMLPVLPRDAYARASDWQRDDAADVRLISGIDGVGQEKTVPLGLDVELAPEWHTYWRSPGMAGLPPSIDWSGSQTDKGNLQSATLLYPAPKRYTAYGLETIGYINHVVFPIDAALRAPGQPLNVAAAVDILVCNATCVPKHYDLKLTVPAGDARESAEADLLRQYRAQLPGNGETSGLLVKDIANDGQDVTVTVESRDELRSPDMFVEDPKDLSFTSPSIKLADDKHSAQMTVKPADTLPDGVTLAGMPLTLTIVNDDHALEEHVTTPPAIIRPVAPPAPPLPLGVAILFAIIGGLILNLMPCVLPVLSLKIVSVIGHGGRETHLVRQSFLVTAGGILFSFLVLAGMTIGLKELGLTLGWGVQFQQPVFLIILILLLTLFAANLWGLFEIHLPRFLADNIGASYHPKLAGDFATGAFATLLATPCSAPFLGTAVGFAFASGPRDILVIFTALGFGMIIPYILVAIFPGMATTLPKPGQWMVTLRRLLGLALVLTAVWLTWVLAAQIGVRNAILAGLAMAGIIILFGLRKTSVSKKLICFGIFDFAVVAIALTIAGSLLPKPPTEVDQQWMPFSEQELAADIAEGKTVFVDVTADWCLTCKANKKFVLSQDEVSQRLFHTGIVAMQADWTNPDPDIAAFLHKYGRYGIPFNAAFGPGAPQGIVLPELLTLKDVDAALDKATQSK